MIVVDTTVWVDFLNDRSVPHVDTFVELVDEDIEVGLTDVILTEILQGLTSSREVRLVERHLAAFPILRLTGLDDFRRAADLYRTARRHRVTVRSTIDVLVASVCIREGAPLLHNDRDYDRLAFCTPLTVYRPGPPG